MRTAFVLLCLAIGMTNLCVILYNNWLDVKPTSAILVITFYSLSALAHFVAAAMIHNHY